MNCSAPTQQAGSKRQPASQPYPLQPPSGIAQPHALQMWKKLTRANQGTKAHFLSPSLWFAIHSSPSPFLPRGGGGGVSHLKIYAPNPTPTCSSLSSWSSSRAGAGGGREAGPLGRCQGLPLEARLTHSTLWGWVGLRAGCSWLDVGELSSSLLGGASREQGMAGKEFLNSAP